MTDTATTTYRIQPDGSGGLSLFRYRNWDDPLPVALAEQCKTPREVWTLCQILAGDPSTVASLVPHLGSQAAADMVVEALRQAVAAESAGTAQPVTCPGYGCRAGAMQHPNGSVVCNETGEPVQPEPDVYPGHAPALCVEHRYEEMDRDTPCGEPGCSRAGRAEQ